MKRLLLCSAIAVFALGASSMAQDAEQADDGRLRIVYTIDPITGEYLFVPDTDGLAWEFFG